MALDKAIQHGKENREPYRGAKAVDCSCRNHGSCAYCESNRRIAEKRQYGKLEDQEDEYFGYWNYPDFDEFKESDDLMTRFGFDPNDSRDMVISGMWYNEKIAEEIANEQ